MCFTRCGNTEEKIRKENRDESKNIQIEWTVNQRQTAEVQL